VTLAVLVSGNAFILAEDDPNIHGVKLMKICSGDE